MTEKRFPSPPRRWRHRVQVCVDDALWDWIADQATQQQISASAFLRQVVTEKYQSTTKPTQK